MKLELFHNRKDYYKLLESFFKYQIVTKMLFSLLILPSFWLLTQILIYTEGYDAISNNLLFRFLRSPQGLIFLGLLLIIILFGIIVEIFGFIQISAAHMKGMPESSYWVLFKSNLRQVPKLFHPMGILVILYFIVLVPLTGFGVSVSFMKWLRVPNFIMEFIGSKPSYSIAYGLVLVLLSILSFRLILVPHFMLLGNMDAGAAMASSSRLIRKNKGKLFKQFLVFAFFSLLAITLISVLWFFGTDWLLRSLPLNNSITGGLKVLFKMIQDLTASLIGLFVVPIILFQLTRLYFDFIKGDSSLASLEDSIPQLPAKTKISLIDRMLRRKKTLFVLTILLISLFSIPVGYVFEHVIFDPKAIQVVAHRGGGVHAAENTIAGAKKAVELGCDWTEIDVQRTADGKYILNHDKTFKRVAGEDRSSLEMTYEQIKKLQVQSPLDSDEGPQPVAGLEEFLDYTNGKIGVYIELKGESADQQMADDVAKLIRDRKMLHSAVILSLDYNMITYISEKHPDIQTGYLYFLAFGDIGGLKGNYLVMEEDAATVSNVDTVQINDKKAVVWTVNTEESIHRFVNSEVDAIITDQITNVKAALKQRTTKTGIDALLELLSQK